MAAALVAAASASARPDGGLRSSGTLRVALARGIDSLDPELAFTTQSWVIENATCAPLLRFAPVRAPRLAARPRGGRKWTSTTYALEDLVVHTGLFRYSHDDGSGLIVLNAGRTEQKLTAPFTIHSDTGPTATEWQASVCAYLAAA